jgi:hypothetical protein
MSTKIISNNPTKSNQFIGDQISDQELVDDESLEDELNYFEDQHYRFEQEVEAAIVFAKKLFKISDQTESNQDGKPTLDLDYECLIYLEEQFKKHFKGCNIHNAKQLTVDFRLSWDQKFLDFLRNKIWECLKANNLIDKPWVPADPFNDTFNAIFGNIQSDLYRFAASVIDKASSYLSEF